MLYTLTTLLFSTFILSFNFPSRYHLLDAVATIRDYSIREPEELEQRQKEVGVLMGLVKQQIAYDQTTLSRTELYTAAKTVYLKKGTKAEQEEAMKYLTCHGVHNPVELADLMGRFHLAETRLKENKGYLAELNKAYREISRAQGTYEKVQKKAIESLMQETMAQEHAKTMKNQSLDDKIKGAFRRATPGKRQNGQTPQR